MIFFIGVPVYVREMRNRRGLTQKELAERINKSVSAISGYESNVQTPPTDVLVSISHVLHVPLTYFVDLSCEDTYSAQGLTDAQKEVLNLLFAEFSAHQILMITCPLVKLISLEKLFRFFQSNALTFKAAHLL